MFLWIILCPATLQAQAKEAEQTTLDTVAVLGIDDSRGELPGDTGLMAGLTDVLSFTLQNRGVRMLDRQAVGNVINERRLNRLLGNTQAPLSKTPLPQATFNIQGQLTADRQGQSVAKLKLTLELYRTRDGSLLQRIELTADATKQLAEVVNLAADAVDFKLIASATRQRSDSPGKQKGFTENPEAALMFYRGLEQLAANRNTQAIGYFAVALRYDWEFDVATVWLYRALHRAGFDLYAQALLLENDQKHQGELRQRIESTQQVFSKDRLVIAVASGPETRAISRKLEQAWATDKRLSVLTAAGVIGATAEQDLKLSGEFEHLPAIIDRWLFADVFLRITKSHAVAYDVKTGQEISRCELANAVDPQWIHAGRPASMVHDVAVASVSEAAMASPVSVDPLGTNYLNNTLAYSKSQTTSASSDFITGEVYKITALLNRVLREPGNVTAWYAVAKMDYSWSNTVSDEIMIKLIGKQRHEQPGISEAPAWLSSISNDRFENIFHRPPSRYFAVMQLCESETPIAQQFKELLEWYPQSTAAWLVRYGMALELQDHGKPEQAIEMLQALADKLPALRWPGDEPLNDRVATNVYYQLARMYCQQNNLKLARQWYDACAQVAANASFPSSIKALRDVSIRSYGQQVRFSLPSSKGYSHRDTLVRLFTSANDLSTKINEMANHLAKAQAGQTPVNAYQTFADLHAAVLMETDDQKRFELQLRSVTQWLDANEKEGIPNLATLQLRQIAWLRLNAQSPKDHAKVDAVIQRSLGESFKQSKDYSFLGTEKQTLLLFMNQHELVRQSIEYDRKNLGSYHSVHLIMQLIELDSVQYPPAIQAERILDLIQQFEKKYPDQVANGSVNYYNLIAQCAPFLTARGRYEDAIKIYQKIIDDPAVPWLYKDGARFNQAQAIWYSGKPEEATQLLRDVTRRAATKSSFKSDWQQAAPNNNGLYSFIGLMGTSPEKLMESSRDSLHRLRLFGGRVKPDTTYQQKITYAPLPDKPYAQAKLYAMMFLMAVPSHYYDFYGNNWWSRDATRSMLEMQEDAQLYAQRLVWAIYKDGPTKLDHKLHVTWHAGQLYTYLASDQQPPEAQMLDWMAWSPVCEVKQMAARCLDTAGPRSPSALTALALTAAMNDGCQYAAQSTLQKTGRLDPLAANAVAALLDHPVAQVRAYAALTLAKGVGLRIELRQNGLPSDTAIASLEQWWQSIDGNPARWPKNPATLPITDSRFDKSASRWLTWGSGPIARVFQANAKPITLNHGRSSSIHTGAISSDGKVAATFSQDHRIRVWDLDKPDKPRFTITPLLHPWELSLSAQGNRLAIKEASFLVIYDTHTGKITHKINHFGRTGGFNFPSAQEDLIFTTVTTYANPTLYDLNTNKVLTCVMGTQKGFWPTYSLDDGRLLTRGVDFTMRLWETKPKLSSKLLQGYFGLRAVITPSADQTQIAGVDVNYHLLIWDARTGKQLQDLGKVPENYINITWPKHAGPALVYPNLVMLQWREDLKTFSTVSFDANVLDDKSDAAAPRQNENHRQTSMGADQCCQLIIR